MSFEEPKKPVRTKGAGELSRLAQQPRSGHGLDWSEATQRSVVGVQVLSRRRRLHPCHVANVGCGAKPHGVSKTLEGRAVGDNVPKAHHKQPLGRYAKRRAIRAQQGFQRIGKNQQQNSKISPKYSKKQSNLATKYRYRRERMKTSIKSANNS